MRRPSGGWLADVVLLALLASSSASACTSTVYEQADPCVEGACGADAAAPVADGTAPSPDAAAVCAADLTQDSQNCGACGHVCGSVNGPTKCVNRKCVFACADGFLHCGDDASGCAVSASTDPRNCGACGHDCLGGACKEGQCQPVELANAGNVGAYGIAVDATRVFWPMTTAGSVGSCPLAGCGGAQPWTIESFDFAREVALDESNVYFGTVTKVFGCSKTGCLGSPPPFAPAEATTPESLRVGGNALFWAADAVLRKCTLPGCVGGPIDFTSVASPGNVRRVKFISLLGGDVYFVEIYTNTIYRCAATGCATPTVVETVTDSVSSFIVDSAQFYYVGNQTLLSCPIGGCAGRAPTILGVRSHPWHLARYQSELYWSEGPTGDMIATCNVSDCQGTLRVLASSPKSIAGELAVDATAVYWNIGGTVMKVAK